MTRSPTRSRCASRAPRSSTSAESRRGRGRRRSTPRRSSGASSRSSASSPQRGIPISIDTKNAVTALAAIEAGAEVVNDVSGGLYDAAMGRVVAETGVTFVAMHWRGGADVAPRVHRRGLRGAQRAAIAHRRAHRRRGRPAADRARSGSRLREGCRAQLAAAVASRRARLARPRHPDRGVAQAVPRRRCCPRALRPTSATCRPP